VNKKLPDLAHIGYVVEDLERSAAGFGAVFQTEFMLYDFRPLRAWAYGEEITDCYFRIGMGVPAAGPRIELIQPIRGENTPPMRFLREHGEGIHHLAYQVENEVYAQWRTYFENEFQASLVFEAIIEDAAIGYRRTFYAQLPDAPALIEIATFPIDCHSRAGGNLLGD
jgi:hypothetical protein